jgi:hypothetical protein
VIALLSTILRADPVSMSLLGDNGDVSQLLAVVRLTIVALFALGLGRARDRAAYVKLWLLASGLAVVLLLMPPAISGRESFRLKLLIVVPLCVGITCALGRRSSKRVPVGLAAVAGLAGVATPPLLMAGLFAATCSGGGCLD